MIRQLSDDFAMQILLLSTHDGLIGQIAQALTDSSYTLMRAGTMTDAIRIFKLNEPAIILLDISSPEFGHFAQKFSEYYLKKPRPAIIILSQGETPSLDVLSLGMSGFGVYGAEHLPPISEMLLHAKQPTLAQYPPERPAIIARTHRGEARIFIDDIFYCQSEQKYTKIHHRHGITLVDDTLKSLESAHPESLIRIHRHTLIGIRHIQNLDSEDGQSLLYLHPFTKPFVISRRCVPKVRAYLANLGTHHKQRQHLPKCD